MKWEFVAKLEKGGHRIFRAPDGRLAIADDSGDVPDETDDGILWLRTDAPLELCEPRGDYLPVSIPLLEERCQGTTRAQTGADGALWFLRNRIFTRIIVADGAPDYLRIIRDAFDAQRPTEDRVVEALAR